MAKTESFAFPSCLILRIIQRVYKHAHYFTEILIQCGQMTIELVALACAIVILMIGDLCPESFMGSSGPPGSQRALGILGGRGDGLRGSWVFSGSLVLRILLDPRWSLMCLSTLQQTQGKFL